MTLEIYSHNAKQDNNYGLGETIKTEINQLAIIPILSDSIYKDPISAIRELYSNEVTSCKLSKLKTRIEIKLNTETRELIIQGFNSMGLTKEVFHKILKVMGNSGNNNGKNSGMFGLGFFSHVKLSEKMIIHSYSQNEERFSFISKSGLSFEILPEEFTEKIKQYGTKMTLTVKDSIDLDALIRKIKDCMELCIIKTDFFIDDVLQYVKQYGSLKELMKNNLNLNTKRYSTESFKIYQSSNDVYDLIIVKQFPTIWKNKTESFLLNVPIEFDIGKTLDDLVNESPYCRFFINVKDEQLIKPHVSRDYFTKESEKILIDLLIKDYEVFQSLHNDHTGLIDLNDYVNSNDRFMKYHNMSLYCKTLFVKKKYRFQDCIINYFNHLPDNYVINGICFLKSSNLKIMQTLFEHGYLSFITNDKYSLPENIFNNITDVKKILDDIGIKNRYGQNRKSSKVYYKRKLQDVKYIFKTKEPEYHISYSNSQIGLTDLESQNKKHLDISWIKDYFKDDLFFTTNGYKTLDDLKDYDLFYVNEIDEKLIPKTEKLIAFITDELDIQLISVYHNFKDHSSMDLISYFLRNYQFKNENLRKLIKSRFVNISCIYDKSDLELLLKLDAYDN